MANVDYQQLLIQLTSTVGNILRDKHVPANVATTIVASLQSNPNTQHSIIQYVLQSCGSWGQGVDYNIIVKACWNWLIPILQEYGLIQKDNTQPSYAQGINPNIGQQIPAATLYDLGPSTMGTEAAKATESVQQNAVYTEPSKSVNQLNANVPRYNDEAHIFDDMDITANVDRSLCDEEVFSKFKDESVKSNLLEIRVHNNSYTRYAILTQKKRFNDPLEAFLATAECIPSEYFHSRWMHEIAYRQLVHIPISTQKYIEVVKKMNDYVKSVSPREKTKEGETTNEFLLFRYPWADVLSRLGEENRNTWNTIDKLLTPVINNYLYRYFRLIETQRAPQISSIGDLPDLADVRNGLKIADHGAYPIRVYTAIYMAFKTYFNLDNVVNVDDNHFGDMVSCNKVSYFKNGYTEYDYGCYATDEERMNFRKDIAENHTVMRIPRRLLVTNIFPQELVQMIKRIPPDTKPAFIIPPNTFISNLLHTVEAETKTVSQALIHVDDKSGYKSRSYFEIGKTMTNEHVILPFKG